ncbi:PilZ domain-containing protein [Spirochaetota bacterium]
MQKGDKIELQSYIFHIERTLGEGRHREAEALAVNGKKQFKGEYDPYDMLAKIYYINGEIKKAVREYKAFLKTNPENKYALNNISCLLMEAGKEKEAYTCIQKAFEADPDDACIMGNLALILRSIGFISEAKNIFSQLLKKGKPDNYFLEMQSLEIEGIHAKGGDAALHKGDFVQLIYRSRMYWNETNRVFDAGIEKADDRHIILNVPFYENILIPLCEKYTMMIMGFEKDGELWGVSAPVIKRTIDEPYRLTLSMPGIFKKVQRRKHYRVRLKNMIKRFDISGSPGGKRKPSVSLKDIVERDLSAGGISVQSKKPIKEGCLLKMELRIHGNMLSLEAEVRRCIKKSVSLYDISASFTRISRDDRERIMGYILKKQLDKKKN